MTTALIVDDSRLARLALSKLLAQHGVASDEAPSAEAALEYLKFERPDVVFLDHTMPGMDGFEALDVIKKKPETTTIPVMMYTSQEGQLYVSQARALGAVGVLPKSMRSADVKHVLQSLHLIDDPETTAAAAELAPAMNRRQLTQLIRDLLYEQSTILREEMHKELEQTGGSPRSSDAATQAAPPIFWFRVAAAANFLALAVVITLAYAYYDNSLSVAASSDANRAIASTMVATADTQTSGIVESARAAGHGIVGSQTWIRHLSVPYSFDSLPLDDIRALELGSLFDELEQSGYAGTVVLGIHTGRYCMNYGADGNLQLAPPYQPAATCEQIGMPAAIESGGQQSIGFANMVASTTRSGRLQVETVSYGSAQPLIDYPFLGYSVTAGDWNVIAARNQRITLQLLEETPN
ncbi:MAG TPA: response regulator [Gammaproteobacteria bacterium]|jgi:CheY-like chemotaxis protein